MKLRTLKEVADDLAIAENTLRLYIRQGRLKSVKIGKHRRVSEEELERFLNAEGGNVLGKKGGTK